jgi:hypothetical protein
MADTLQKTGLTPVKMAIIGLLAVVLLAIVLVQFTGSKPGLDLTKIRGAKGTPSPAGEGPANRSGGPAPAAAPAGKPAKWQGIPRSEVVLHDPFALPAKLRPGSIAGENAKDGGTSRGGESADELQRRRDALFATLREKGVGMILSTPQGPTATIGTLQLRVGDIIEGLRVAKIGPQGVEFVEDEKP